MYYAILVIGHGRRHIYSLQQVTGSTTHPVNGVRYCTLEAAQQAAAGLGVVITKVGDFYSIL